MKISDIMKEEGILPNLTSRNKLSVLRELSNILVTSFKLKHDTDAIVKILEAREELGRFDLIRDIPLCSADSRIIAGIRGTLDITRQEILELK